MYRSLMISGELQRRATIAHQHLAKCDVCPLECNVNRLAGELGVCRIGINAKVSSFSAHHGEEDPLRGWKGSGTIFFTRCNLKCQYCQNHDISQTDSGIEVTSEVLADIMLQLQSLGCHNINFVSPSHVIPQIISALVLATEAGLQIPLVYNSGGYDSLRMLRLLDGVIDIYLPDMKYGDPALAQKYSKIPNYVKINQSTVKEMHRQVGDLVMDNNGLAIRGLLVRHLVLPGSLAFTNEIVHYLAKEISKETYLNLMDQYYPSYLASRFPEINRPINKEEFQDAVNIALQAGLHRFD